MNVLLVVSTMLMLLAMMTYARIEMFRSFSTTQALFENYIQNTEREYINKQAEAKYDGIYVNKSEKDEYEKKEQHPACSKISFAPFLEKGYRNQERLENTINLTTNLLHILYQGHSFFDEAAQQNPDFIKQIFDRIMKIADALPKDKTIYHIKDLATFDLGDPHFNVVFTKMLHGNPVPKGIDEAESKEEYPSLLDFITVKKKLKIRVYLAPQKLLAAIFNSPEVANAVVSRREEIYRDLRNKFIDSKQGEEIFREAFLHEHRRNISEDFLDFSVSKTDPKDYRSPV